MKTIEQLEEDVLEAGRLVAKINDQYRAAKKAQAKAVAALQQFELSAISQAHYIQHEAPGNCRA